MVLFRNWINYNPGVDGEPFVGAQFMAYEAAWEPHKVVVSTYELTGIDVGNPTTKYFRGQGYLTDKVQIKRIEYCDPIGCRSDGSYEDPDYYPYTYLNPIDVVLVIDRSGSMSGNKLWVAKQSAKMFVDLMRPGDKVGVVAFGSSASVVYPLQEILATGTDIKGEAKNAIDALTASGGTSMGAGLQLGQLQLNTNGQSDPIRLMLLLSDGVENGSPTADQVLPSIIADKITVHTLALGFDADIEKLENIADQTGGIYRFALANGMTDIFYAIYSKVYGESVVKRVSGTVLPNSTVEQNVAVDSTIGSMNFSINWPGSDLDLTLVRPDGMVVDPTVAENDPDIAFVSNLTYEFYTVYAPQPGIWTMRIFGKSTDPSGEDFIASVSAMNSMILSVDVDKTDYFTGDSIKLTASVEDGSLVDPLDTDYVHDLTAQVTVIDPGINTFAFELYDDGLHGDGNPDDGVYANTFDNTGLEGSYNFNVQISGNNIKYSQPFTREEALSISVMEASSSGDIVAGSNHTCALTPSGGVYCWGRNSFGQLGDGTTVSYRLTPVGVSGLTSGVTAISAGGGLGHTCALMSNGGVKCWGVNNNGQLGDGTTTSRSVPTDVSGMTSGMIAITTGDKHTCALTANGGVKCWGYNSKGQLGDGTTTQKLTPVDVSGLTSGVIAISAGGEHTCAVLAGGGVKCWGDNSNGQLGDDTTTQRLTPVDVSGLTSGVSIVSAGDDHTCAVTTSGGAKCWGDNYWGTIGDGTLNDRTTPVGVSGLTSGVVTIEAGETHTCAVTASGGAMCWGSNIRGELGDGTDDYRTTPVDVIGLTNGVVDISAGGSGWGYTCGVTISGDFKCWGTNTFGQLGNGTTSDSYTPVDVSF